MHTDHGFILRVRVGTDTWSKLGLVLENHVGRYAPYDDIIGWFKSQNARYVPQADRGLHYYTLEFDSQEELTEFVLKWL